MSLNSSFSKGKILVRSKHMDVEEEKKEKKVTSENNSLETENDVSKE